MHISKDSIAGKNIVITGASSGIGKAAAKLLAYSGARIALLQRSLESGQAVLDEIGGSTAGHLLIQTDVADSTSVKQAFETIGSAWGHVDSVIANAGSNGVWAPLEQLTVEEWDSTLGVNLRGTFLTVQAALPLLKKCHSSSIVVVSSINGNRIFSNTGATAYACSKAAQVAFMKMIALELAPSKIRVNAICPGSIDTPIGEKTVMKNLDSIRPNVEFPDGEVPLTRGAPGLPGQVAELIWFLCSDAASHITGTEVYIDGGQSLMKG